MQKEMNNLPSMQLDPQLLLGGRGLLSAATSSESFMPNINPQARLNLQMSIVGSLRKDKMITTRDAFGGTPLSLLLRQAPELSRHAMVMLVKYVSDTLDMNKRLKTTEEYMDTVRRLLDNPYGKNYTLEDFRVICDRMIGKKYFERCKWYEFKEAWEEHDGIKHSEGMRRQYEQADQARRDQDDRIRAIRKAFELEHHKPKVAQHDWFRGEDNMSAADKERLQQKDRERRNQKKS